MRRLLFSLALLLCAPHRADAQAITKGPWLLQLGDESAWLRLETEVPSPVTVTASEVGGGGERTFEGRTATHPDDAAVGTVRLAGLQPNTRYEYIVRTGTDEERGELWTAPEPGEPLTFLVYGDNRTKQDVHVAVVERMLEETDARIVLHTGDFVEMGGRPSDWGDYFRNASPLVRRVGLFPSLGNHELYGPGGIARYHRYLGSGDGRETWYRHDYGDLTILALDSNVDWEPGATQYDWLTATLASIAEVSADRFVVVIVHHGPYSSGRHGGHGGMQDLGLPEQLRDAGVDVIFSGHDHDYERGDADGLKYVVTGGGGAPLYTVNDPTPYQLAFEPAHHFVRGRIEDGRFHMRVVRLDGSTLEDCSFAKGEPWECEGGAPAGPVARGISRERDFLQRYGLRYGFYVVLIPVVVLTFLYAWRRRRKKKRAANSDETS